nr:YadA-like family protein [Altererythrobacter sp. KTW20L]
MAIVAPGSFTATAQAQTLQPVVDLCTGITLPRSAVTEIIGAVNQPIVNQVESTVNGLTTVTLILAPLASLTDLDIDLTTILADAAAGDPISLQILDTDGNVITASDDCNVTADGFALNQEGGIAIGGNAITGLGANGQAATAGEIDAIAFGNNASTAVGATGAVAIGTDASATAVNSVALGAGSVADRGPQTGYAAPGLAGTFDSAGSVSVGSAGALRQITNVAPGTAATDAATVGQVQGALDAIADLGTLGVQYDDATQASVTLGGAGGTTVTNVADGAVSAASSDAVNGSQLFATNTQVATNTATISVNGGNIATNTADIAALDTQVTTNTTNISTNTADIAALDTQVATNTTNISSNTAAIGTLQTDVTTLQTDVTTLQTDVTTLQTSVTTNTADIVDLRADVDVNTSDIADLQAFSADAVRYDDASHTSITFDGAGGTTLSNVAAGALDATSTEAVNGSQLFATNQQVATNTTDITNIDARVTVNEGDIANLETDVTNIDARVTVNEGDIASLETDVTNIDARVTTNTTDIANVDTRLTVNEGNVTVLQQQVANVPIRYVSNADGSTPSTVPTDTVALVSASGGAATLTTVAAGELSAGSTDAVNGGQLFATNQQVTQNTTAITTINNNLAGSTVVAVQYSDPDNPTQSNGGTITNDVTFVGADPGLPVRVHNVANGLTATDAVNLGQMQAGLASTLADARSYTDERFNALSFDLGNLGSDVQRLRRDAFAGSAAAMAFAGIPQTMEEGRSMVGGAIGHFRGQTAFAIGASTTLNDGAAVVKAGGTLDTRGKGGFSAGAGFSF